MALSLRDMPVRLAIGAFFLNSARTKFQADEETSEHLHKTAATAYPFLADLPTDKFIKALGAAEAAVGAGLVLPFVPSRLAGLGLTAFAGGLVGMYLRTPGLREEGKLRPTPAGIPLAKDSWLLGAGVTLLAQRKSHKKRKHQKLSPLSK